MTSYPGLPEKHRALVIAFREALAEKIRAKHGVLELGESFESIDTAHQAAAERHTEKAGSPRRAANWQNAYKGFAESQKLRVVYALAQNTLTENEIAACAPAGIEEREACFSRYELEKNGLTDMTDYLVPKKIRDIGLF